ncbi:MAG TPA: SRPBCC domain-containing protein [Chitinophagaceae bacterium]|nr:SRPBCC domain-containing protein [Chitinophagaceae bacterium]
MAKSIHHTFFFAHSPEVVWEYLTNAELIGQWLMKNNFQPILGYDFTFNAKPIPSMDLDGIFYCKVLEIVPFKKLCYSWKGGPGEGKITLNTIVTWKLEEKDGGVQLDLKQSGFGQLEHVTVFAAMTGGWLKNVQKINDLINAAKS